MAVRVEAFQHLLASRLATRGLDDHSGFALPAGMMRSSCIRSTHCINLRGDRVNGVDTGFLASSVSLRGDAKGLKPRGPRIA